MRNRTIWTLLLPVIFVTGLTAQPREMDEEPPGPAPEAPFPPAPPPPPHHVLPHHAPPPQPGLPPGLPPGQRLVGRLLDQAGVSGEQKVRLTATLLLEGAPIVVLAGELAASRMEVIDQLLSVEPDAPSIEATLTRMEQAMTDLGGRLVDLVFALRRHVTREQHETIVASLIEHRLGRPRLAGKGLRRLVAGLENRSAGLRRIARQIEISSDQRTELKRLVIAASPDLIRGGASVLGRGLEIAGLLIEYAPDRDVLRLKVAEITGALIGLVRHGVGLALKLRDVLSPTQFERLVSRVPLKLILKGPWLDRGAGPGPGPHPPGAGPGPKPPGPADLRKQFRRRMMRLRQEPGDF